MQVKFRMTRKRVAILIATAGLISASVAYALPARNNAVNACPAGTVRVTDFCSETKLRGQMHWNLAMGKCENRGRHLPDVQQIAAVFSYMHPNNPYPSAAEQILSGDFVADLEFKAPSVSRHTFVVAGTEATANPLRFFCVVYPN